MDIFTLRFSAEMINYKIFLPCTGVCDERGESSI